MYVTLGDIVARFGLEEVIGATRDRTAVPVTEPELADYLAGDASPSAGVLALIDAVDEAIADAEARALSYVESQHPEAHDWDDDTAPVALKKATLDLVRYNLHARSPNQRHINGKEDAERWLNRVAMGNVSIGVDKDKAKPARSASPQIIERKDIPSRVFPRAGSEDAYIYGH